MELGMKTICLVGVIITLNMASGFLLNGFNRKVSRYPVPPSPSTDSPSADYKIFEGDIRVSKSFDPKKRNAVADKALLWPAGIIPYTISNRFNSTLRELFKSSMSTIEELTKVDGEKCIQFVPHTTETDYVHLEMYKNCWSDIGRLGIGEQVVSLGMQCYSHGTVMHELLHSLGFFHEQSRADRDYYVDIHYDNIRDGAEENFQKYALGSMIDHLNQPYDYDSIMHYQPTSFSRDSSSPTITPKIEGAVIGQRDHLSEIDIKMIQKLYGCTKQGQNGETKGKCMDKLENCYLYGEYACSELPDWAAENCALTCKVCQIDCEDKRDDCSSYGSQVCEGVYKPWAEQNCAKFCSLGDCKSIVPQKQDIEDCEDVISDCADYTLSVCQTHKPWAESRCKKFCGFCGGSDKMTPTTTSTIPTTTQAPCKDVMECSKFSKGACYVAKDFMNRNCRSYCGFCSSGVKQTTRKATITTITTTQAPTTTTTTITTTTPATTRRQTTPKFTIENTVCEDKIDDCSDYGKSTCTAYKAWMNDRCPLYCGFCERKEERTTPKPECYDALPDCADYGESVCSSYPEWASINCQSFCHMCAVKEEEITSCEDKISDCASYGRSQCYGIYTPYMKENCAKFCELC